MATLLTRKQFKEQVFARDNARCVVCGEPAMDAHHIMERRLWPDGGYYLDNGVSLCAEHHMAAERTDISTQDLRDAAGIAKVLLPEILYAGEYDKWGNVFLPDGKRMIGELFYDESVQKVLAHHIAAGEFTQYVKYPRTPHLPYSPGYYDAYNDDVNWSSDAHMNGVEVVVLEKMDGENTTMYRDYVHARSLESGYHPTRTWVKNLHAKIAHDIPVGWRICGENLFGEHSLHYDNLISYFEVFSIWDGGRCLSWDDTETYCQLLGLNTVPVIYRGLYHEQMMDQIELDETKQEGYVVRPAESFRLADFRKVVAKYVRANHINDNHHWMHNHTLNKNKLGVS